MKRYLRKIWQMILAAVVVASLGVGVTQLQATASTLNHCHPDSIGHCSSTAECDNDCRELGAQSGQCFPSGCCFCLF